jgi:SLOG in TRPM, prokaryote/SMODS and SLOG-associating 2TM effector domain 1/Protein of unknown function (DUF4231)
MTQSDASQDGAGPDSGGVASAVHARSVTFPEGQKARIVEAPPWGDEAKIVKELGLAKGRPVILLVGGADGFDRDVPQESELRNRLLQLFGRGLLRTADAGGAIIVDGGTNAGVMALLGAAARHQPRPIDLLGVAPAGKVSVPDDSAVAANGRTPLEPNHTHFVLVDSATWGGETSTLVDLAQAIADTRPVVVVVVHGGEVTKDELVRSVRRHWPVIVVAGFGGVADEIAKFRDKPTEFIRDTRLAEVVADGRLLTFRATDAPTAFSRMLSLQLGGSDTLQRAVDLRTRYAHNSRSRQEGFFRLQWTILGLGVLGTALALVHDALGDSHLAIDIANRLGVTPQSVPWWSPLQPGSGGTGGWALDRGLLHHVVVLVPLVTSVLLSASIRFNAGAAWVALRSSSEAIKAEVFRYRARAGIYSDQETTETSRDFKLAEKLDSINRRLMQSQANLTALQDPPPRGKARSARDAASAKNEKDEVGFLTPDGYVHDRLEEQLSYYRRKAKELDSTLFRYQALIWGAGLVGSFLAAIGHELWIALTTGLAAAFGAYLKYRNVDRTLTGYNQAAAELDNVILWWSSLSTGERVDQVNIDRLVDSTENVLAAENSSWLQQMENVLEGLRERQRKENVARVGETQNGEPAASPDAEPRTTVIAVAQRNEDTAKPAADTVAGTARP